MSAVKALGRWNGKDRVKGGLYFLSTVIRFEAVARKLRMARAPAFLKTHLLQSPDADCWLRATSGPNGVASSISIAQVNQTYVRM